MEIDAGEMEPLRSGRLTTPTAPACLDFRRDV